MTIGQTGNHLVSLVIGGLTALVASGLAGAHGAPEVEGVPDGIVKAQITKHPDIPGLSAMILDAPRPGILLRYKGEEPLTVLGADGEAFIRFTRTEVTVNTNSPSWKALPNPSAEAEETSWVTLSQSGSFGWLDARLNALHDTEDTRANHPWSIPLTTERGDIGRIEGNLTFTPIH
ncbi:hypothetical protein [Marinobacter algicola]|uniref:Uncharacterized protein n=1 Tax=Marinobacter algicola DG893 TaxID=443152 RepID=A6EZX1_9GAMM|nr:hypothetical protein [Marinobacter algicola]EDM47884.1 hypothetical protein MDG893_14880 [Marinobacter algicola DG893]